MEPSNVSSPVRLTELAGQFDLKAVGGDPQVFGLTEDSRSVRPGDIFAAIKGLGSDGRDYIDRARDAGAAAVMLEEPDLPVGPRLLFSGKSGFRPAVSRVARTVYGCPDQKLALVGLTGTNGKSSIAYLLEDIFREHGLLTGIIGTVNYRWPGQVREALNTTPEGPLLYRTLAEMVSDGCRTVVMEVSSHALELGRVEGLEFSLALFTNLTQDHLDFHLNFDNYFAAKKKLFTRHLKKDGAVRAAVGVDDPYGSALKKELGSSAYGYGLTSEADIKGCDLSCSLSGIRLAVQTPWGGWEQDSPLIGSFNALNILGAVTVAGLAGVPAETVKKALARAAGAPGRLEKVSGPDGCLILVDYAHTPAALETALTALRELNPGRLLVLFGCGGDRDRLKRPLMGMAAGSLADLTVLTSDNPRTEDAQAIIRDAQAGLDSLLIPELDGKTAAGAFRGYLVEPDRRAAIFLAVSLLRKNDILLIAGKGHEDYQIIRRTKIPFDDRLVAKEALEKFGPNSVKKAEVHEHGT
ncbi:MAG: UDP-N-acetylmuramoyl-L-alanyl-D-glutamate--2,6-diaminopimelate ligase [Deltaproteobacteria bacterium]|nr:UDP-N-acetylmuramoyl-L-alanyl-D-glutamate--2,6-diaminopimelate ligase [Deltaproteobacteria bacterium]